MGLTAGKATGRCPVGWGEVSWDRTSLEEWRDPEWEGTERTLKEQIVFQAECWFCIDPKCCLSHDPIQGCPILHTMLQRPGQRLRRWDPLWQQARSQRPTGRAQTQSGLPTIPVCLGLSEFKHGKLRAPRNPSVLGNLGQWVTDTLPQGREARPLPPL